jgi:DNA-binding MarR family transcriptional regulator
MRSHLNVKLDANAWICKKDGVKNQPSEDVVRAWTRLLRAQQIALSRVQDALRNAGLPPLAWYDVMLELDRAGEPGLRPFELEKAMLLPQYGLSRLLDRIAEAGYIDRQPCDEDGRGQRIVLTKSGREMRRRIWPVYASAINAAVGAPLSEKEAARLAELLGKLIDRQSGD